MAAADIERFGWERDVDAVVPAAPWLVQAPARAGLTISAVAVAWRFHSDAGFEVALVRRRRQRDWGFPKGSVRPGEDVGTAVLRELAEETGITAPGASPLANLVFASRTGRTKLASYWLVRANATRFQANREVNRLLWLTPARAGTVLTLARERLVLDLAAETLGFGALAG